MVAGVPSMHVCLDFIPELINQPQLDKQVYCIKGVVYELKYRLLFKRILIHRFTLYSFLAYHWPLI